MNNALKFTQSGSVTLAVAPEPGDARRVRFSVIDTGIGIGADKLGSIFEAFSQADQTTTRRFGGTGLGLAIGKKLVAAMGGDLVVASEPGRGSTFHFSLPLSAQTHVSEPPRVPGRSPRALVGLPGPSTSQSAALYLNDMGFDVAVGEIEALRAAAEVSFVLVTPKSLREHGRPALAPDGIVAALADPGASTDDLVASKSVDVVLQYPLSRAEILRNRRMAGGRKTGSRRHCRCENR